MDYDTYLDRHPLAHYNQETRPDDDHGYISDWPFCVPCVGLDETTRDLTDIALNTGLVDEWYDIAEAKRHAQTLANITRLAVKVDAYPTPYADDGYDPETIIINPQEAKQ